MNEVVIEKRVNTEPPGEMMEVSASELRAMDEGQLLALCDRIGIAVKPGAKRELILQTILMAADEARDEK